MRGKASGRHGMMRSRSSKPQHLIHCCVFLWDGDSGTPGAYWDYCVGGWWRLHSCRHHAAAVVGVHHVAHCGHPRELGRGGGYHLVRVLRLLG